MTKCPLGWGQFAKVIGLGFERHFPDKNIVCLQASWTTYARDRIIGFWNFMLTIFSSQGTTISPHPGFQTHISTVLVYLAFFHLSCHVFCWISPWHHYHEHGRWRDPDAKSPGLCSFSPINFMFLSQIGMVPSHINVNLCLWTSVPLSCAFSVQSQLSSPVNSEWAQGRTANSVPWDSPGLRQFRETQWVVMTITNYSGDTDTSQNQRQVELNSNKKSKVQET